MSFLDDITVLILTYNEEPNLARTLQAVKWARRILIVDSGSTDATLAIAGGFSQAEIVSRAFDNFAEQCNFGLAHIPSGWVLSMDADYVVSYGLSDEIARLKPPDGTSGYTASFVYRIYGKPLRSTLYPPRTVLYRRDRAFYRNEGHGHRVAVEGTVETLRGVIYHDDRKPLSRWLSSQQRYAKLEADHLLSTARADLNRNDRIRLMAWPAPLLVFFYTLFLKRCILDGWPGWLYVLQRVLAETLIALEIVDRKLSKQPAGQADQP